jgi:hypothetical protein
MSTEEEVLLEFVETSMKTAYDILTSDHKIELLENQLQVKNEIIEAKDKQIVELLSKLSLIMKLSSNKAKYSYNEIISSNAVNNNDTKSR